MYEAYFKMTPTELHKHLLKRNLHPDRIAFLEDDVAARKEARRKERITRTVHKQAWLDVLQPLRYELNNARVGLQYVQARTSGVVQRREAFEAYVALLEKLLKKLDHHATLLADTPAGIAKEKNASKKGSPITNDGKHWTDWVPPRIKEAISQAFAAMPHHPKAKRKVPFQGVVTPEQHAKRKEMLLKRTRTDQSNAERNHKINPTEDNAHKLRRINNALKIIEGMESNEFVPTTWHGVEASRND